jgi:hypothetical protein
MEVNLNRNAWYNKLQIWTLKEKKPNLFNLCPYFWLTVFCIIIIPFTLIFKVFKYFKNIIVEKQLKQLIENLTLDDICNIKYKNYKTKSLFLRHLHLMYIFDKWFDYMLTKKHTKEEIYLMINNIYEINSNKILENKKKIKIKIKKPNNIWWIPVVKYTRLIIRLIINISIINLIILILLMLIMTINFKFIINLGMGLIFTFIIYFLILLIVSIKPYIKNKFKRFFKFFKKDYCPGINWNDENIEIN